MLEKSQFFKDHYFFELERRHKIVSDAKVPLQILLLLGGILFYLAQGYEYDFNAKPYLSYGFITLLTITAILWAVSTFFLWGSYYSLGYEYIAPPIKFIDHYESLKKNNNTEEFQEAIDLIYAKAATNNAKKNSKKTRYLQKSSFFLVTLLAPLTLCCIIYFITYLLSLK